MLGCRVFGALCQNFKKLSICLYKAEFIFVIGVHSILFTQQRLGIQNGKASIYFCYGHTSFQTEARIPRIASLLFLTSLQWKVLKTTWFRLDHTMRTSCFFVWHKKVYPHLSGGPHQTRWLLMSFYSFVEHLFFYWWHTYL